VHERRTLGLPDHFRELLTRSEERIASNLLANFNPSQGSVVAVRVSPDGTAGTSRTHAAGVFCDDFAFDVNGNLYCGTDPFNTVVRIASDGTMETILAAVDGLDAPTAVLFAARTKASICTLPTARSRSSRSRRRVFAACCGCSSTCTDSPSRSSA